MKNKTICIAATSILLLKSSLVDASFSNRIIEASNNGEMRKIVSLVKSGHHVNMKSEFGSTPLMRAAYNGFYDTSYLLIKLGANVNDKDYGGETALHLGAKRGDVRIIDLLLENGAKIDEQDNEGWTALMRAIMHKKYDIVRSLINQNADITKLNNIDESAVILAAKIGNIDIAKLIVDHKDFANIRSDQKAKAIETANKREQKDVYNYIKTTMRTSLANNVYSHENVFESNLSEVDLPKQNSFEPVNTNNNFNGEEIKIKEIIVTDNGNDPSSEQYYNIEYNGDKNNLMPLSADNNFYYEKEDSYQQNNYNESNESYEEISNYQYEEMPVDLDDYNNDQTDIFYFNNDDVKPVSIIYPDEAEENYNSSSNQGDSQNQYSYSYIDVSSQYEKISDVISSTEEKPIHYNEKEYFVNMGQFKDYSESEIYWMNVKFSNEYVLKDVNPYFQEYTNVVNLYAGPFKYSFEANELCSNLQRRNIACSINVN